MLYESNNEWVPLTKEINYIRQLMALEQLRNSEPQRFDFSLEGNTDDRMVAPLLLVPFIENIFKHGVLNDKENPVTVKLEVTKNRLFFHSRNKINCSLKDNTSGIGLINVKRRLELLYPGKYQLSQTIDGEYYSVNLTLQLL